MTDPLIESLTRAVEATPYDVRLRTHLAELLVQADRSAEAVTHCAVALQYAPTDERARTIMTRALSPQAAQPPVEQPAEPALNTAPEDEAPEPMPHAEAKPTPSAASEPAPSTEAESAPGAASPIDAPQDSPFPSEAAAPSAPSSPEAPAPTMEPGPALSTPPANTAPEPALSTAAENADSESMPSTGAESTPETATDPAPGTASPVSTPQASPAPTKATTPPAPESPEAPAPRDPTTSDGAKDFDWRRAEEDFDGGPAAPFVSSESSEKSFDSDPALSESHLVSIDNYSPPGDWEVERADICLADVGGMVEVKNRLEASFLAPMRNPELRRLYGKSLRGGLLLYGPPGTGKTFIARAIAGEMGAGFLSVTLTDILDHYMGISENNLHRIFQKARNHAPCVLFLDEIDALGIKRSLTRNSGMRSVVNQLLEELDGIGNDNEGVYILAATNTPWDIDPALRRPGRLDRTLLVLPPDEPARAAILHTHLRERPVEGIDLQVLARMTEGLTGADLSHVCDSAAEKALIDSVRTGQPRFMNMQDMYAAIQEIRPSTGPWFETARTVIEYADSSGEYADLREWMKRHRML